MHHYNDVIMSTIASQITSLTIVYLTVYSGADQRKKKRFASLAFVRGIHRWPVNSPRSGPVTRKKLPFDDVIMIFLRCRYTARNRPCWELGASRCLCTWYACNYQHCMPPHRGLKIMFNGKMSVILKHFFRHRWVLTVCQSPTSVWFHTPHHP